MPLAVLKRVVFHQDSAIPHTRNARMNVVFLNHFGAKSVGSRNWHGYVKTRTQNFTKEQKI
jgi:hypothetical protein